MERQTKHRILGILVIIGLVIILLPLFQGGKELSREAVLVKAPPFPDRLAQTTSTAPDSSPVNKTQQTVVVAPPETATPLHVTAEQNSVNQNPDDIISVSHPSVINTQVPVMATPNNTTIDSLADSNSTAESTNAQLDTPDKTTTSSDGLVTSRSETIKMSNYRIIEGTKAASLLKKTTHTSKHIRTTKVNVQTPIDDDGLIKLKSAVWVIQIGSFKNKANALRVVNQLRANGYRAFIQQISTALGDHTRVFVGPENKRTSARALADRLRSEMHIQGIVISYKPLTL